MKIIVYMFLFSVAFPLEDHDDVGLLGRQMAGRQKEQGQCENQAGHASNLVSARATGCACVKKTPESSISWSGFCGLVNLVCCQAGDCLHRAARPCDFNRNRLLVRP